jgi:hypothetical protein
MKVPVDDWTDKLHKTISRRIARTMKKAGETDPGWAWFNNALDRGYYIYLTSTPKVSGFTPLDGDVEPVLVDALKAIHPPEEEYAGRFRPYGGSDNWTARVETTGEEDKDRCRLVAVRDGPVV